MAPPTFETWPCRRSNWHETPLTLNRVSRRAHPSVELGMTLPLPQPVNPTEMAGNQIPPAFGWEDAGGSNRLHLGS